MKSKSKSHGKLRTNVENIGFEIDDIDVAKKLLKVGKINQAIKVLEQNTQQINNPQFKSYKQEIIDKRFNLYLDDSSDDEKELNIYSKLQIQNIELKRQEVKNKHSDLEYSMVFQELGSRILHSEQVGDVYFAKKTTVLEKQKPPVMTKEVLQDKIYAVVDRFLPVDQKLQQQPQVKTLTDEVMEVVNSTPQKIFGFDQLRNNEKLQGLHKRILDSSPQQQLSSTVKAVYERKVDKLIEKLYQIPKFKTAKGNISKSSTVSSLLSTLATNENSELELYHLMFEIYKTVKQGQVSVGQFRNKILDKFVSLKNQNYQMSYNDFVSEFNYIKDETLVFREGLESNSTCMSYSDFNFSKGMPALLSHIRLIHWHLKRHIKNVKNDDDFEGENFCRSWQFVKSKEFCVIEQQKISLNGLATSMVLYPYNSNYPDLISKLSDFQVASNLTTCDVVLCIKNILQKGKIDNVDVKPNFEKFLQTFTYHLFGVEVERHPASLIHNAMALQLVEVDDQAFGWNWLIGHLPMCIDNAVQVVRHIQKFLANHISIPYFYDKADSDKTSTDSAVVQFINREKELFQTWLEHRGGQQLVDLSSFKFEKNVVEQLNILCKEYYDIPFAGEICDY